MEDSAERPRPPSPSPLTDQSGNTQKVRLSFAVRSLENGSVADALQQDDAGSKEYATPVVGAEMGSETEVETMAMAFMEDETESDEFFDAPEEDQFYDMRGSVAVPLPPGDGTALRQQFGSRDNSSDTKSRKAYDLKEHLRSLDTASESDVEITYVDDEKAVTFAVAPEAFQSRDTSLGREASDSGEHSGTGRRTSTGRLEKQYDIGEQIDVVAKGKGIVMFNNLRRLQIFSAHIGSIYCMAFSVDGSFLATAGQDGNVCIWGTGSLANRMRPIKGFGSMGSASDEDTNLPLSDSTIGGVEFLRETPYRRLRAHKADILSLSWSEHNFLISGSADRTARLWHPSSSKCLRKFVHPDMVTAVQFHPHDENVFVSGCVDGVVRLWSIPGQKLLSEQAVRGIISTLRVRPDGASAVVGTCDGLVYFFKLFNPETTQWRLKLYFQLDVRSKSSIGKGGTKIVGVEYLNEDTFVVNRDDGSLRLYTGQDKALRARFEASGHSGDTDITLSVSPVGQYVLSGDARSSSVLYIWDCLKDEQSSMFAAAMPDAVERASGEAGRNPVKGMVSGRVKAYESFVAFQTKGKKQHSITAATFAPHVDISRVGQHRSKGLFILVANVEGFISVFENMP
ncbi:WD repeat-containing protein 44 [Porphyridium purpureum]|uniref:WD repeat-containing protein 44 n=1 Tax=Porphyridium purpureum TaxID=35688 RepID=A0A5J4YSL5_PORPP|nr:WD repeat-containing protein 44 [Porphyridium purpureum]|eukprot:POR2191..scf236_6